MIIGGSSEFCYDCQAWSFFWIDTADGGWKKTCVHCKERRDHPYGAFQYDEKEKEDMPNETANPVCKNPKCSHYCIQVCDVEARRNRCGYCFTPLNGNHADVGQNTNGNKPTVRVHREGKFLRLNFTKSPERVM